MSVTDRSQLTCTSKSFQQIGFATNSAIQHITDCVITEMVSLSEAFYAEDGATIFMSGTSIRDNNITSEWTGVSLQLAKGTVQKSSFLRNIGMQVS
jgi:hypothetical protein